MMFETLILIAAATAQLPSDAPGCRQPAVEAAPVADTAISEMAYNAFVAVEETPAVSALVRPAIAATPARPLAVAALGGTAWIS